MILNINHREYSIPEEHQSHTLLDVLRNDLHLMGTKKGCGTNDCGACKVLLDGEAVNSCMIQARRTVGKSIITIEGIKGEDGELHPIQQAFIDCGAIQCGFCTPGMVIRTKALLDRIPDPTEEQICDALSQNICRCTGYVKIVEAVKIAARLLRERKTEKGL